MTVPPEMTPTAVAMLTVYKRSDDWARMWAQTWLALDEHEQIRLVACVTSWLSELIDEMGPVLNVDRDRYLQEMALRAANYRETTL